jgi:hypothetical protein
LRGLVAGHRPVPHVGEQAKHHDRKPIGLSTKPAMVENRHNFPQFAVGVGKRGDERRGSVPG